MFSATGQVAAIARRNANNDDDKNDRNTINGNDSSNDSNSTRNNNSTARMITMAMMITSQTTMAVTGTLRNQDASPASGSDQAVICQALDRADRWDR